MARLAPPQAVPGTAAADGVDPGGSRPHGAPAQLLRGQRWREAGRKAAAPWRGLRTSTNKVNTAPEANKPTTLVWSFSGWQSCTVRPLHYGLILISCGG